jgi:hypothetical protein
MKNTLCTTLLVAGLAGNVFVYGQVKVEKMQKLKRDSVRILLPDHMPCLVTDLSKVERMPIKKLDSRWIRPMPNGVPDGRPHVQVVPRKKE